MTSKRSTAPGHQGCPCATSDRRCRPAIPGERGSGVIGINGAAAHLVHPGDLVIIMSYAVLSDAEARSLEPRVVHVDEQNRIVKLGNDAAEPVPGSNQKRGDLIAAQ